ncbi:MAG: hypothetical protein Q7S22_08375 [Candidatus Micrarchaeota archaeon]|nr:hypothetical protein [Candidatus Micrarchaeota archaeon]
MSKAPNYSDNEILLTLILSMPKKMTKGQIGRILGIKSAGQKHWRERFEKLGQKKLLSIEKLNVGELFSGSPILTYYLSEIDLEQIWSQYFISYDERHGVIIDPFLTPFSAGIWDVSGTSEFSKLIGSKFNYYFLCAKNEANLVKPSENIASVSKEKTWKVMDAVLSIGWKTEAYRRKPVLMDALTSEQKKTYAFVNSIYEGQIKEHPADYRKFIQIFDKNFKHYL